MSLSKVKISPILLAVWLTQIATINKNDFEYESIGGSRGSTRYMLTCLVKKREESYISRGIMCILYIRYRVEVR